MHLCTQTYIFFVSSSTNQWRELLFTAPKLSDYVSGAILYEETLYQDAADGTPFTEMLTSNGMIPGIKVDTGLLPLGKISFAV